MALYLISIIGGDALIILFNLLFSRNYFPELSVLYIVIASILAAILVIAIDGVLATFIRRCLPEKWFAYNVKLHNVSQKECKLYEKLGIKHWKDKVLELGVFTNFSKKTIADPHSREYMERFILECNYGAVIHLSNAILGFLLIFCYPLKYWLLFAFPACIINFVLSMLPYMILRYNVPRLQRARNILEKKEERENARNQTEENKTQESQSE